MKYLSKSLTYKVPVTGFWHKMDQKVGILKFEFLKFFQPVLMCLNIEISIHLHGLLMRHQ